MKMNLGTKHIKKIGSDIFAFDFRRAKEYGIELELETYNSSEFGFIAISKDGTLFLNTKHEAYHRVKSIYQMFGDASTDNLIQLYKMYDSKCPDVRDVEDIDKYTWKYNGDGMIKIMLKYELLRREYKSARVQPLMNMLLHGECD
jgi:hypothetical protein